MERVPVRHAYNALMEIENVCTRYAYFPFSIDCYSPFSGSENENKSDDLRKRQGCVRDCTSRAIAYTFVSKEIIGMYTSYDRSKSANCN